MPWPTKSTTGRVGTGDAEAFIRETLNLEAGNSAVPPVPLHASGRGYDSCLSRLYLLNPLRCCDDSWVAQANLTVHGLLQKTQYYKHPVNIDDCPSHPCLGSGKPFRDIPDTPVLVAALPRLYELWRAGQPNHDQCAPPPDAEKEFAQYAFAVEFRWWCHVLSVYDRNGKTPGGHPDPLYSALTALGEPPGHAAKFFPPSWYWRFCRANQLSEYQALLVGMATYSRCAPHGWPRLRRPAAWAYRASWARPSRRPLFELRCLLSDFRFFVVWLARRLPLSAHSDWPAKLTRPSDWAKFQRVHNWVAGRCFFFSGLLLGALATVMLVLLFLTPG